MGLDGSCWVWRCWDPRRRWSTRKKWGRAGSPWGALWGLASAVSAASLGPDPTCPDGKLQSQRCVSENQWSRRSPQASLHLAAVWKEGITPWTQTSAGSLRKELTHVTRWKGRHAFMLFRDAQMMGQHIRNSPWLPRLERPAGGRSKASCKMRTILEAPGCQASFSSSSGDGRWFSEKPSGWREEIHSSADTQKTGHWLTHQRLCTPGGQGLREVGYETELYKRKSALQVRFSMTDTEERKVPGLWIDRLLRGTSPGSWERVLPEIEGRLMQRICTYVH